MLNISLDDVDLSSVEATKKFEAKTYEPTPQGTYAMQVAANRAGEPLVKVSKKEDAASGAALYSLSIFYKHADSSLAYNGVNYNVEILGVKTVTDRTTGEAKAIDLRSNLVRFLLNYGFTKEELRSANIAVSGLQDAEALEAAGWKGVSTDITINGQSIGSRLTSTTVNAIVKQGKKNPFIAAISQS